MQLLKYLVHSFLFVLEFLELGEFDSGRCSPDIKSSVRARGRVKDRPVLRWTNSLGGPRPAHLSGERKTFCLTTVVWHSFSLENKNKEFNLAK